MPAEGEIKEKRDWLLWSVKEAGIREEHVKLYMYNDIGRNAKVIRLEFHETWMRGVFLSKVWERKSWRYTGPGPSGHTVQGEVLVRLVVKLVVEFVVL